MKFSGGTHRHRPVSKRRDDALALPKFNFSILEQPRDCACSRTENVEPRKMHESPGPGTLNQRATCVAPDSLIQCRTGFTEKGERTLVPSSSRPLPLLLVS